LYALITNFGSENYILTCKDGTNISSNPVALQRKSDVFGSIFDKDTLKSICQSRKLVFGYRLQIRPGLHSCVVTGTFLRSVLKKPTSSTKSTKNATINKAKAEELKITISDINKLNNSLKKEAKIFNMAALDQEIRELKKKRNVLVCKEERRKLLSQIKEKKNERWEKFSNIHSIRTKLKEKRSSKYSLKKVTMH
jgi:hypothetical protein